GNETTAEQYVRQKIELFCQTHGLHQPDWRAVDYEVSNPRAEERLVEVINTLSPEDEVFLDVTGGPRDVNILMLLVIRTLSYLGCHVVKTIYSDNTEGKRQIRDMGDTTRLFDMLNGMQELTSFGSVSTLRSYYENTKDVKIDSMLTAMQQLNETLSLCRTGAIKGDTNRFCNALTELKRNCRDPLMEQLLPVFQNKFGENPDELTMILWYVENGMIQQALTIYTERVPTYILQHISGLDKVFGNKLRCGQYEDRNTVLFCKGFLVLAGWGVRWSDWAYHNRDALLAGQPVTPPTGFLAGTEIALGEVLQRGRSGNLSLPYGISTPEKRLDYIMSPNFVAQNLLNLKKWDEQGNVYTATLSHLNELLPNSGITCDDVDWVATAGRRYLYIKLIRNMIAHANEVTTQEKQLCDIQRHKDEDCAEYCDLNTLTVAQIGTFLTESVHHLQRKA
ncbi:MAG: TM1812 family CRISPR-associated protein, partial [Oscillospiraceae bacterium]